MTSLSDEEYYRVGAEMNSPLFEYTFKNFNQKRTEFCYAGYWSATLNLCTGWMTGCYGQGIHQNIYKDLNEPIKWRPIGSHCCSAYCVNSSHFMSQGIIPSCQPVESYCSLRNREAAGWYTQEAIDFLSRKFEDENKVFSPLKEKLIDNCLLLRRKAATAKRLIKAKLGK